MCSASSGTQLGLLQESKEADGCVSVVVFVLSAGSPDTAALPQLAPVAKTAGASSAACTAPGLMRAPQCQLLQSSDQLQRTTSMTSP